MNAGSWELVAPLGAGPDGVTYRARLPDGTPVEVRTFTGSALDPERWPRLLHRLRLAQMLDHPAARRVVGLRPGAAPPAVALAWSEAVPLAAALAPRLPLPVEGAVALALELAGVLHAAHRLGLGHGGLSPETVRRGPGALLEVDFTAPPSGVDPPSDPAASLPHDVAGLAGLLVWLLGGPTPGDAGSIPGRAPEPLRVLLGDMLAAAEDRPGMAAVEGRLRTLAALLPNQDLARTRASGVVPPEAAGAADFEAGTRLGRFHLLDKLGAGGMGEVYRAEDGADGRIVAVKTILPVHARNPDVLQRFLKEARLLGEVRAPEVARLLEVNEDAGRHYLVVEFVPGPPLSRLLEGGRPLPERFALAVAADVCRALVSAHARNVLHRDVKPDNILLTFDPAAFDPARIDLLPPGPLAKLADFGLARHIDQAASMSLTQTGDVLGTPRYLSPEQCSGAALDGRSDLYSLGATLFHGLTGRPPFLGDTPLALINQHCNAPAPSPCSLVGSLSDGACRIVERALAKAPGHRHESAAALLRDLEDQIGGKPSSVQAHPRLPAVDPARLLAYDFAWDLASSPAELWPYVSNTERLNRAIHLPAVEWAFRPDAGGRVRRLGSFRTFGREIAWEEHPFEWVEGQRFGILRSFTAGPFRWLLSLVELAPDGAGTKLVHRLRAEPSGVLGRAFAAVELGFKTRRKLDRVYRRVDAVLRGRAGPSALIDAFEGTPRLSPARQRRLDDGLDALAGSGVAPEVVELLGAYLATGPAQELGRIRPIALARRLGLDAEAVCAACLHATRAGLLTLSWDLLCPLCRVPAQTEATLAALPGHAHCPACAADYAVDFSRSVEAIFRAHPSIRQADTGTYCVGGPSHSPHVIAQVRLGAGERLELALDLAAGAYRLRGPQLPASLDLIVEPGPHPSAWAVDLGRTAAGGRTTLRPGGQTLALLNPHAHELVVRLERAAQRGDALTAARAASMALFRELFPGELLAPGRLVSVSTVTLLATDLSAAGSLALSRGEGHAFAVLHDHLGQLEALARQNGGALLKAVGHGAVAAFHEPADAVRTALALTPPAEAGLRLALQRGPALAATVNDRLDYFGAVVRALGELLAAAGPGERLLGQSVLEDPAVDRLLGQEGITGTLRHFDPGGYGLPF